MCNDRKPRAKLAFNSFENIKRENSINLLQKEFTFNSFMNKVLKHHVSSPLQVLAK